MSNFKLILRSLLHYWRTNLAVLLGVVAGTAVIGGALIVGDSVRGSLQKMTYDRLGKIDHVLTGPRFFRQELAEEVANDPRFNERFETAAPALVLTGGLEHREVASGVATATPGSLRRVGNVNIYGVEQKLWEMLDHGDVELPRPAEGAQPGEIVLNQRVADQLDVTGGETIRLWIELPATIPRDTLLGNRDRLTVDIELKVKAVLPDSAKASRLNLAPNQQFPLNAFVSLPGLQQALGLAEKREGNVVFLGDDRRRTVEVEPARINTIFFSAKDEADAAKPQAVEAAEGLTEIVRSNLTLRDLYLRIATPRAASPTYGYLSLESKQQVLAEEFGEAGKAAAKKLRLKTSPVLVYLANKFENPDERKRARNATVAGLGPSFSTAHAPLWQSFSRYSVIAGVDTGSLNEPPFGPFEFIGPRPTGRALWDLGEREIVINDWLAGDLNAKVGDEIRVTYHVVGAHVLAEDGRLPEEEVTFTVKGIVKLANTVADDRGFTPEVEGITDVRNFEDWTNKPFPMKKVTERDQLYWNIYREWHRDQFGLFKEVSKWVGVTLPLTLPEKYRATPKAFVSLDVAQNLWRSRYGSLTSVRVSRLPGKSIEESKVAFADAVLQELSPRETNLVVRPVKYEGLQAASGTTDFSGLFLAFSFFLILSATILIGLLFRLGVERRGSNVGLLGAVGFSPAQIRRMFLTEGLLVVVLGGLLGILAAWGYAELMVYGLKTWWIGAIGTRYLFVYVTWQSVAIGFASSVIVAAIAVWWALRYLRQLSNRELLAGATEPQQSVESQRDRGRRSRLIVTVCGAIAGVLLLAALTGLIPDSEAFEGFSWQIVAFFVVGMALLVGALAALAWWLNSDKSAAIAGRGLVGTGRLGMRNAARHRQRSVMTVALIASATFVIVAVAAGHRDPAAEEPDKDSGNGGFTLVARSSAPILHDLNTRAGREKLGIDLAEQIQQARNRAEEAERQGQEDVARQQRELVDKLQERAKLLEQMNVVAFPVKPGEDASCLNIYQTRVPTILGAPQRMIERGGFKFIGAKVDNPWTLLNEQHEPQEGLPVYPVLGDANTLKYSLKKGLGATIPVPNEDNPQYLLKVVGMFDGSVFQGVLLMSEGNFRQLYRDRVGYEYFLVEIPPKQAEELETALETGLRQYGFDSERVAKRIANFLAVQNTYLSTFQTLGGLGLLLGTLGLATVMLRNVLERRSELALLRAVGFRNSGLSWLVVIENALLLLWGLLAGAASALLAMTPHLLTTGAKIPWEALGWILAGVFAVGMIAALAAVRAAVRTPIVATLRSE